MSPKLRLSILIALFGVLVLTYFGALGQVLRVTISLALVLVLPGLAIVLAVFPPRTLRLLEMFLYSVGVSLATTALGGIVLNLTPWGLRTETWVLYLGLVTVGMGTIAALRRGGLKAVTSSLGRPSSRLAWSSGLLMVVAALVLTGAMRIAAAGEDQQPAPGFTQLWILAAPVNPANPATSVRLGIINRESTATSYRLQLTSAGRAIRTWQLIRLASGAAWQATVALPSGIPVKGRVDARLYRTDVPRSTYREAWLQHGG